MTTAEDVLAKRAATEMLRRTAERTMQAMIISMFKRLQTLPTPEDEFLSTADVAKANGTDGTATPRPVEDQPLRMTAPDPTSGQIPAASTPSAEAPGFHRSMSYVSNNGLLQTTPMSPVQEEEGKRSQARKRNELILKDHGRNGNSFRSETIRFTVNTRSSASPDLAAKPA